MGADIHLFIEWRLGPEQDYVSLTAGEFILPRDYDVFAALAGVRGSRPALVAPRGFPDDATPEAHRGYFHRVSGDPHRDGFDGNWITELPEHAEDYVKQRLSTRKTWRNLDLVSDPDAHHASWLSAAEFAEALSRACMPQKEPEPEYAIVVNALQLLDIRAARAVFWFDN